jgi:hypothetical protein
MSVEYDLAVDTNLTHAQVMKLIANEFGVEVISESMQDGRKFFRISLGDIGWPESYERDELAGYQDRIEHCYGIRPTVDVNFRLFPAIWEDFTRNLLRASKVILERTLGDAILKQDRQILWQRIDGQLIFNRAWWLDNGLLELLETFLATKFSLSHTVHPLLSMEGLSLEMATEASAADVLSLLAEQLNFERCGDVLLGGKLMIWATSSNQIHSWSALEPILGKFGNRPKFGYSLDVIRQVLGFYPKMHIEFCGFEPEQPDYLFWELDLDAPERQKRYWTGSRTMLRAVQVILEHYPEDAVLISGKYFPVLERIAGRLMLDASNWNADWADLYNTEPILYEEFRKAELHLPYTIEDLSPFYQWNKELEQNVVCVRSKT